MNNEIQIKMIKQTFYHEGIHFLNQGNLLCACLFVYFLLKNEDDPDKILKYNNFYLEIEYFGAI